MPDRSLNRYSYSVPSCTPVGGRPTSRGVLQEAGNPLPEAGPRDGLPGLPVLDGLFRDAEHRGRLPSDESSKEPGLLEMVAQGPRFPRTPPRERHRGGKAQVVKGQLIPRERGRLAAILSSLALADRGERPLWAQARSHGFQPVVEEAPISLSPFRGNGTGVQGHEGRGARGHRSVAGSPDHPTGGRGRDVPSP